MGFDTLGEAVGGLSLLPAYRRIEHNLRARIRAGHLPTGTMLPSRKNLAKEYGVALRTVERAIANLLADGTLRADNGRGTFVAGHSNGGGAVGLETGRIVARVRDAAPIGVPSTGELRAATLGIIGALYPPEASPTDAYNFWMRAILSSVERIFSERGGTTQFFNRVRADQSLTPAPAAIASLLDAGVDALIVVDLGAEQDEADIVFSELSTRLSPEQIPAVYVLAQTVHGPIPHVFYDNEDAGYQAAQHLIGRDWQSLLFIAPFTAPWLEERIAGARVAAQRMGQPATSLRVFPELRAQSVRDVPWEMHADYYRRCGYQAARAAFAEGLRGGGIIAANDKTAFGVLEAAAEAGLVPGVDFALIGFDDDAEARALGLTSLRPPLEALGQEAARLILAGLASDTTNMQIRLRSHLAARASTRCSASMGAQEGGVNRHNGNLAGP